MIKSSTFARLQHAVLTTTRIGRGVIKKKTLLLLQGIFLSVATGYATDYGLQIIHPEKPSKLLQEGVADAVRVLGVMTGKTFNSAPGTAAQKQGIILTRADAPDAPRYITDSLKKFTNRVEAFVVRPEPGRLLIVSHDDTGLCHGLYTYLHELGARWYLPGQDFEIIPKRSDITIKREIATEPAFRSRWYFPTGAFGVTTPVDPKITASKDNDDYRRRNRWGGAFMPGGHDWDAFVGRHKETFLKHPEYLALFNGARVPVEKNGIINPSAKLCVSNKDVIELYAQDRIDMFNKRPALPMLSVEPSDGGGFCQCPECAKIGDGSPSDQAFYLANEVAKRVARLFPDKRLSLLAYHLHAAPPSFPIEPNVFVQVAPYAFQSTVYSPDELLRAWGEKLGGKNLGVYDYWILPDSNLDMPSFNFLDFPANRIKFWREAGCDSFMIETTFSAGANGLALYLMSLLAWDPGVDTGKILKEFYTATFGEAAEPMQELLELWARRFELTPQNMGLSFQIMNSALEKSAKSSPEIRRRVLNFANYLQYVRLVREYRKLWPGAHERSRHARDAVKLLWRMHFTSRMAHTFRLQWMIRLRDEKGQPWINDFDMQNHSGSGWTEVMNEGPIREDETLSWIKKGVEDYGPKALRPRIFSETLAPLNPAARPPHPQLSFNTNAYTRFSVFVPPGVEEVVVFASDAQPQDSEKPPARLMWYDNTKLEGEPLINETLGRERKEYRLPAKKPGVYELLALSMSRTPFNIQLPALPVSCTRFTPANRMDVYFFVPVGVNQLVFKTGTVPGNFVPLATNPHGVDVVLDYEKVGNDHYFYTEVPEGSHGIWCLRDYRSGGYLRMITVPQALAFHPDGLMVPIELLKK